jgi:hypothetical protein
MVPIPHQQTSDSNRSTSLSKETDESFKMNEVDVPKSNIAINWVVKLCHIITLKTHRNDDALNRHPECKQAEPTIGENRPLVTDEPVEFEK